jgi:hypothetical protein
VLLFFVVIAVALAIATLIGGDVRRLTELRVRHLELLAGAFAAKIAVAVLGTTHSVIALNVARPLNVLGALLLLGVAWFNRQIPGALIFGAGLLWNLVVIVSFGGRMPVLLPPGFDPSSPALPLLRAGLDPLHILLQHPDGLWFMGDIWAIPSLFGHSSLVSIGDLLMASGVGYLIVRWCQRPRRLRAMEPSPAK